MHVVVVVVIEVFEVSGVVALAFKHIYPSYGWLSGFSLKPSAHRPVVAVVVVMLAVVTVVVSGVVIAVVSGVVLVVWVVVSGSQVVPFPTKPFERIKIFALVNITMSSFFKDIKSLS